MDDQLVRLAPDTVFSLGTLADLVVGTQLQIEGFFDASRVLVATEIEFFVDLEGVINRVTSADTFEVDGQPVRLTPDTVFENGTIADLAIGVRVEGEGRFDASGVLVAIALSFLQSGREPDTRVLSPFKWLVAPSFFVIPMSISEAALIHPEAAHGFHLP